MDEHHGPPEGDRLRAQVVEEGFEAAVAGGPTLVLRRAGESKIGLACMTSITAAASVRRACAKVLRSHSRVAASRATNSAWSATRCSRVR